VPFLFFSKPYQFRLQYSARFIFETQQRRLQCLAQNLNGSLRMRIATHECIDGSKSVLRPSVNADVRLFQQQYPRYP
jgi:hypothetical protein